MMNPQQAEDAGEALAYRERLEGYLAEVFSMPMVGELIGAVSARQSGSLERVEALRALDVNNPVLWPFHAPQLPLCMERAEGSRIWDVDGNEYLDCHLGLGTQSLHGHNPPEVVEYVQRQLGRGVGANNFHPVELELCRLLQQLVPHCEKFAFFNTGSDATAAAVRLARAHSGKRLVVKFEGAMLGVHDLGVHNTITLFHGHPAVPFPPSGPAGVAPNPFPTGVSPASAQELLVLPLGDPRSLEIIEARKAEIACVTAEPVYSAFPFAEKTVPFVKEVAALCQRLGVIFLLDEVTSGFRCSAGGGASRYQIPADLYTYGKVMSGLGIPLSAVGGRAEILDHAQTSGMSLADYGQKTFLNSTHHNNHLSLAAGYATLRLLAEKGPAYHQQVEARIARLQARLAGLRERHQIPLHLIGFGEFMGTFLFLRPGPMEGPRDLARAANGVGSTVLSLMMRLRGIYFFSLPVFFSGGAHSDADLERVADAVEDSVLEMKRNDFPFLAPAYGR